MIEISAQLVASAEQTLADAKVAHDRAAMEASALQNRMADLTARMGATRNAHAAGDMTDQQAGGLFGILSADRDDLARLVASAEVSVTASAAALTAAESKLSQARLSLEQATQAQRAVELTATAKRLEDKLTATIAAIYEAGIRAGKPRELSAHWQPGQALQRAISLRVPPTLGAHP